MKIFRDINSDLLLCAVKNLPLLFKLCRTLSAFPSENNKPSHVNSALRKMFGDFLI